MSLGQGALKTEREIYLENKLKEAKDNLEKAINVDEARELEILEVLLLRVMVIVENSITMYFKES